MELIPPPKIEWPLEIGKWGVSDSRWRHSWGNSETVRLTWQVLAYEEVDALMYGRLKAFRIVYRIDIGSVQKTLIAWYAPKLKRLVKIDGDEWFSPFQF